MSYRNCTKCNRRFYSQIGKVDCKACMIQTGDMTSEYVRRKTIRQMKNNCQDVMDFESEIKILATKNKWNMLSHIDLFRIANIFIAVTCNENVYSTLEPDEQCKCMISDLIRMLSEKELETKIVISRAVVRVDSRGRVLEEYKSMTEAAKAHDVYVGYVQNSCRANLEKLSKKRLKFRWKKDI